MTGACPTGADLTARLGETDLATAAGWVELGCAPSILLPNQMIAIPTPTYHHAPAAHAGTGRPSRVGVGRAAYTAVV